MQRRSSSSTSTKQSRRGELCSTLLLDDFATKGHKEFDGKCDMVVSVARCMRKCMVEKQNILACLLQLILLLLVLNLIQVFSNFRGTSWRFLFSHALFGLPRSPLGLPVSLLGSTGDQTSGSGFYFPGLTPYAEFPHASFADFLSVFLSRPRSRSRYNAARSRGNRQRHFSGTKTEAERKRHTN